MKKLYKFIVVTIIMVYALQLKAQIPVNDPAWTQNAMLSDDFTGTILNSSKWSAENNEYDGHGAEAMYSRNVIIAGGHMKIVVDTLIPAVSYPVTHKDIHGNDSITNDPFYFQSGSVNSNDPPAFKYGYLEISAKYPVGHRRYWPGFWVWGLSCATHYYNEIDICENGYLESESGHQMGTNVHTGFPGNCSNDTQNPYTVINLPKVDSIFHKYAAQWDANNIKWYFDDVLVRAFHDADGDSIPQNALQLVFDVYVGDFDHMPHMPKDSLVIDYFNYYTLNAACTTNITISVPSTNYNSIGRPVGKTITTVTVGSNSPTFNTDDQYTLRATDYILLDVGTEVDAGTLTNGQFSAIISPCPN